MSGASHLLSYWVKVQPLGQLLNEAVSSIVINSELAKPGSLFIAIRGERHDGHTFIPAAREKGASLVISDHVLESEPYLLVPNTHNAMHAIAKCYRDKFTIPVIGLTGSAGKTSTKDIVAAALSERFHVMKTQGNLNNETGAPLTLFSLQPEHEVAVVEMGTNHFGEIDRISAMVQPDICLFTNIGYAHIENFGTREGIFRGKTEMLRHMRPNGRIVANGDDEYLSTLPGALLYGLARLGVVPVRDHAPRNTPPHHRSTRKPQRRRVCVNGRAVIG